MLVAIANLIIAYGVGWTCSEQVTYTYNEKSAQRDANSARWL